MSEEGPSIRGGVVPRRGTLRDRAGSETCTRVDRTVDDPRRGVRTEQNFNTSVITTVDGNDS